MIYILLERKHGPLLKKKKNNILNLYVNKIKLWVVNIKNELTLTWLIIRNESNEEMVSINILTSFFFFTVQ